MGAMVEVFEVLDELDWVTPCAIGESLGMADHPATHAIVCRGCGHLTPTCEPCYRLSRQRMEQRLRDPSWWEKCIRCSRTTADDWDYVWRFMPLPTGGA